MMTASALFQHWQQALKPPALQFFSHPLLTEKQVSLAVLRTDLVHPVISGNKAYKLKYNLEAAIEQQAFGVLSFGGAWSNHLHALAYSCRMLQLPCVAVIRGEPELIAKSAMLQDIERWGCQLHFVSRKDYRRRDDPDWLEHLAEPFPGYFIVPEGGSSALAEPGVAELSRQLEHSCRQAGWQPDQLWCAVGTGGTLAGLIAGRKGRYQLVGVPVLKGAEFLEQQIEQRLSQRFSGWQLLPDGHFGGYGRVPAALSEQMQSLETQLQISRQSPCRSPLLLEPVYTAKLFCRFWQALEQGQLPEGSRILLLHTGGVQGRRGFLPEAPVVQYPFS